MQPNWCTPTPFSQMKPEANHDLEPAKKLSALQRSAVHAGSGHAFMQRCCECDFWGAEGLFVLNLGRCQNEAEVKGSIAQLLIGAARLTLQCATLENIAREMKRT